IKIPQKTDIQRMFEEFQNDFADMTLGYGLMSVLDDSDNGRGPTLIRRSINQRDINLDFMEKTFKPNIRNVGLQNAIAANAIIVGVEKSWIKSSSLKPLEDGLYTNRVEWVAPKAGEPEREMILYNGNHRCYYMKNDAVRMQALVQYQQACNELAKKPTDQILVNSLKNAKATALKVIEKDGSWVVRFVDMAKLKASEDYVLIQHYICENHVLAAHEDTDNDALVQVLTTLGSIDAGHFESYLNSLLVKLKSKRSERLVNLLKDKDMLNIAIALYKWPHMRSRKGHTGMSARHFSGWNPVMGGLMKYFAKYMTRVLDFLSMPYNVASIETVKREAEDEGKDADQLLAQYASVLRKEVAKAVRSPLSKTNRQVVDEKFLEPWSKHHFSVITSEVFEHFGSTEPKDSDKYKADLKKYWSKVTQHCLDESKKIDAGDTSNEALIIRGMAKKVEWIRSGLLFRSEPYMATLPLPSKFLLPNILSLFTNPILGIEKVLIEVITWVEPLVKYALKQPNSATRTRIWNDALGALLAHANGDVGFKVKIITMIVEQRRTCFRACRNWIEQASLFQLKEVDVDLVNKEFIQTMKQKVKRYHEQLGKAQMYTLVRPAPVNIDLSTFAEKQRTFASHVLAMLQVTQFPWEDEKNIGKVETLIKSLAALYASKDDHRRFLITQDGWSIRVTLGNILNDTTNSTWKWWDGLDEQPQVQADEEPIDMKRVVPRLDTETTGNFVLRLTESELIRKTGYETVDKVTKLVLQNNLGFVVPGVLSPPVVNALKKLVKAMIVETEKHIAHIEFPKQELGEFEASDAVAEKLQKGMPKILLDDFDHQKVDDYWAPTSDNQQKLANISVVNRDDFVDRNYEEDDLQALEERRKKLDRSMAGMALWNTKKRAEFANEDAALNKALNKHKGKSSAIASSSEDEDEDERAASMDVDDAGKALYIHTSQVAYITLVFLSGSRSISGIGKDKQPAIKRTADQMEMDSEEEEEHTRQSQRPRLESEEERESSDDEVDVEAYTWEMFHKAMKEGDFEVEFDTTPILLRILQHVLAMAELDGVEIANHIDRITNWDSIPTAQEILVVIQSVAQHLDDPKYIDAAKRWAGSRLAMTPSTATDSDIYSQSITMDSQATESIKVSDDQSCFARPTGTVMTEKEAKAKVKGVMKRNGRAMKTVMDTVVQQLMTPEFGYIGEGEEQGTTQAMKDALENLIRVSI
ncbi:hypothetical protein EV363DRAFT_1081433, partial [Boletus edulis]